MRTTLTVDDDIMARLKEEAHKSGLPLKQVVNRTLAAGLQNLHQKQPIKYQQKTVSLGPPLVTDLNKALQVASHLEVDAIMGKLEMRK